MIGKRITDQEWELNSGEYSKHQVDYQDGKKGIMWVCRTPNGHYGTIVNHSVIEHKDDTITVSPSILLQTSKDGGKTWIILWHGYLIKGEWKEC